AVSVSIPLAEQLPLIARVGSPYSWSFSKDTFSSSKNSTFTLAASSLPDWLSLDPGTGTLHGTPAAEDEGARAISITATEDGSGDIATSKFTLCVTSSPPPVLNIPVQDQFRKANPSLSSVFLPAQGSALSASRPALRIPEGWSFSIGFEYGTFNSSGDLYYAGLQSDGSPLPSWVRFNSRQITFDGVTPSSPKNASRSFSLALHASDQEGYSAGSQAFDIVVSTYELSLSHSSLPTINITASTPFSVDFSSPADFTGVSVDGNPIQPADIQDLAVDVSQYSYWLHYDQTTRTLSGEPPDQYGESKAGPVLPVKLTTIFNQTIYTNVSLAVVPSFFSTSDLNPLLIQLGTPFTFDLVQYFSNETTVGILGSNDVDLSASFDPAEADQYLEFDADKGVLAGNVPQDISDSDYAQVGVTFTAYSHITHSTSHTSMNVSWSLDQYKHEHATPTPGLSNAAHAKLLLALEITFGIIGGVVLTGVLLAGLRQCTKVEDTALLGVEAERALSEKDKQWYGLEVEQGEDGYGWSDGKRFDIVNFAHADVPAHEGVDSAPIRGGGYGSLRRVLTRLGSPGASSVLSHKWSPRSSVMRKDEFMGRLRATVRQVSDRCRRGAPRPTISKPTLVSAPPGVEQMEGLPSVHGPRFDGGVGVGIMGHLRNSVMSLGRSVSSSSNGTAGNRSIPRRRADFVPPGREDTGILAVPANSVDSVASSASYEGDAVVQTATKAMSVRSARSVSGISYLSQPEGTPVVGGARPRLVPFTSAARVPVPTLPPMSPKVTKVASPPKRVASQKADVLISPGDSGDDLELGVQYVRALGEETNSTVNTPRGANVVPRVLLRCGESFRFVVPIASAQGRLVARMRDGSGAMAPPFLRYTLKANGLGRGKEAVEFWGTPGVDDLGEVAVGVYGAGAVCVGRVDVEVVRR
ncbi:hypothetical protein GLOTRDRAFT_25080, partial [Gloeophyllum trabeum ATCC 11539]